MSPNEDLRRRESEFREAAVDADALVGPLSARQLWWRPAPDRWSVGECLEHLVKAGEVYLVEFDEVIADARRAGTLGEGPFRRTRIGRWVIRFLEPPPRWKVPAPRVIRPRRRERPPLPRFVTLQDRLIERLDAADGLDLGEVRMRSPFVRLLRFDLGSAFDIVAAHQRRHLWQARRVRDLDGFPGR